ncbi:MAG TPA: WcaI family glycosyltransferase [Chitinophagaceae bacterium]|jgi:colanic acid biosynthesis glycosyl transferase WcaI
MQVKRILIIGGNYYPEPTGIGKYNGEMVDILANLGYHCTVITSYPYYPYWKVQEPYTRYSKWYKRELKWSPSNPANPIEIYRCPQFVPNNPTGKSRMILDLSFFCFAFLKVSELLFRKKYDSVITVAPSFQIGLLGIFYKKIRGAKFLYHIQDLQIDAARDLQMIKSKFLIKTLLRVEKYILKNADTVSSISAGMIKKIGDKYKREIIFFPNWVDVKSFYPVEEKAKLKEEFNLCSSDKVVLYSGAIGEKQGLESILYAAQSFRDVTNLKFVICGSGPYKDKLKKLVSEEQLNNVFFLPIQPSEKLNSLLNMADIHLVLQKENAGDLVMPSKLTTILSVGGLVIVSATPGTNLYQLVSSNGMGIIVNPGNQNSLPNAIENVLKNNYENVKRNARKYAEEFLSIDYVFQKYIPHMQ